MTFKVNKHPPIINQNPIDVMREIEKQVNKIGSY